MSINLDYGKSSQTLPEIQIAVPILMLFASRKIFQSFELVSFTFLHFISPDS